MSIQNSRQVSDVKVMLKTGVDGVGIASIEKTGTSGVVDTYTITMTDGRKTTFTVTNGNGIESIEKTSTVGLVDTYTITFTDETTFSYEVTNGQAGGMSAKFIITTSAGSDVSVTTPSGIVIPATQVSGSTTEWECETTEYGIHTITATLGGDTATKTVNVDTVKIYEVNASYFEAYITVNFAGTCTCSNGAETLTATSSPYVFAVPNAGTWTITSVANGETYTDTVSITTDGQTETVLIPLGSTVTPTDSVATLLSCAGIDDTSITTLSDLLADSTTLSAVISSHNAVDYLARSTTWASTVCADQTAMSYIGLDNYCADTLLANSTWRNAICNSTYFESVLNVSVPTMTSDTAPSGTASANAFPSANFAPYRAFDKNTATNWGSSGVTTNAWIAYNFGKLVKVYKFYYNDVSVQTFAPKNVKVQRYVNNAWTDVSSFQCPNDGVLNKVLDGSSSTAWRLYVTDNYGGNTVYVSEINFYGREDV